jgi:hypothetical protein
MAHCQGAWRCDNILALCRNLPHVPRWFWSQANAKQCGALGIQANGNRDFTDVSIIKRAERSIHVAGTSIFQQVGPGRASFYVLREVESHAKPSWSRMYSCIFRRSTARAIGSQLLRGHLA